MKLETQLLQAQLDERRRNLRIIEELIDADPEPNEKLVSVRDFLLRRIKTIEQELASNKFGSVGSREAISVAA